MTSLVGGYGQFWDRLCCTVVVAIGGNSYICAVTLFSTFSIMWRAVLSYLSEVGCLSLCRSDST